MRIGVLGTGVVGRTVAAKLDELGHDVMIGTRGVQAAMAAAPARQWQEAYSAWQEAHPGVRLAPFEQAAAHGELVINATSGTGSMEALHAAGAANLEGKILIDIANPLDFSGGMPPTLTVVNTDSLGEQIQRAFPAVRVVKTLNTMTAAVMVAPDAVGGGDHHVFLSGDDTGAKQEVASMLRDWFGWRHIVDLGDITTARGTEMYLALWIRTMAALGSPMFNVRVVQ
jgi:predicted dinucleotide-binding enzyme